MIDSMKKAGKKPIPTSIAYYSIQRAKSGRRSYRNSRANVMNPGYLMDNEGSVCFMQASVGGENEDFTVGDMIAARTEDIVAKVLREIDWDAFM
ncbi:MAG: hypothetical protein ACYC4Q_04425 [Victivallaceae bacterium]